MITKDDLGHLSGCEVHDDTGHRIGTVGQVYTDPENGEPLWVTVRTGSFGFQESFAPLDGARLSSGHLTLAVGGDRVQQAPLLQTDGPLEYDDADRLIAHYGLTSDNGARSDDDAMTRSEQRLVTGTRREAVTRMRLRKYVVTEERQVTVPVRREEVRLEEVPVTGDEPAEPEPTDGEASLTLYAEQPVVTTETVPVERVRLAKETVHGEETVTGTVRKERIDQEWVPATDKERDEV